MSDHLPECLLTTCIKPCAYCVCICDRLRQAEQRVRESMEPGYASQEAFISWGASCYKEGRYHALTAAQEAVLTVEQRIGWIRFRDTLAAIEALRGDTDDR